MNAQRICAGMRALCAALLLSAGGEISGQDLTNDSIINTQDAQTFLHAVASGTASSAGLDVNGDRSIDLRDALLYGQWANGLWHGADLGFPTLYLSNQADTAAYASYRENVLARKDAWSALDLAQRYPDKSSRSPLNYSETEVAYVDQLARMLSMEDTKHTNDTAYINGFVRRVLQAGVAVYSAKSYPSMYAALDIIHSHDMPLLFTTDALLQTIYLSYDNILIQLESNRFAAMLDSILKSTLAYCNRFYGGAEYVTYVKDYVSCALLLLNPLRTDISKSALVANYLSAIAQQEMINIELFGGIRLVDFSQFKPRGHYTKSDLLTRYFQAMMWLSRADLSFDISGNKATANTKKAALVLWDCVVNSGAYPQWLAFNDIIEFMVGQSDGLSIKGMGSLVHDLGPSGIPTLLISFNEPRFDSTVARNSYGIQLILSQGKSFDTVSHDTLALPSIFSFMPQRFVIDSYTFSQLVFPFVNYRPLPSSMDIAFVLGDNSALRDHPDISMNGVAGILGSQRELYDRISPQGWQSTLYTSWLNALRKLNGAENNAKVSPVFRTSAWQAKMRNTQLTSWAQLRHNTILYAKQSYTGMIICQYPMAYVEPYPEFFASVSRYADKGKRFFDKYDAQISAYFGRVSNISEKLRQIAELTVCGKAPTKEEYDWLCGAVIPSSVDVGCGFVKVLAGWYFDLMYDIDRPWAKAGEQSSYTTIADVHTKPLDEIGPAQVLHAASGYVNLMVAVIEIDSCKSIFVGPVGSYYDIITSGQTPQRLTDREWMASLDSGQQGPRPAWTSSFMYQ